MIADPETTSEGEKLVLKSGRLGSLSLQFSLQKARADVLQFWEISLTHHIRVVNCTDALLFDASMESTKSTNWTLMSALV